jgi:UDP-N-acetylmuramate dehydrogenase
VTGPGEPRPLGLHSVMRGTVRVGEPLARHTTIRVGGPAGIFAVPETRDDLRRALAWAEAEALPWRVIGLGSNLLCPDGGFAGLVLSLEAACGGWRFDGERVVAGAGAHLAPLLAEAARRGLRGLEGLAGVPGTVGGALAMNAGTPAGEMADVVEAVWVVAPGGELQCWSRAEMRFGYRRSRLQEEPGVAVAAALRLRPADGDALRRELRAGARRRRETQPLELPSAGSIWQNPPGEHAGRLVEAAGCKGWRRGDAQVSPKHANFIVNLGRASARDVLALMAEVRAAVAARFGVRLHPEIRWLPGQDDLEALLGAGARSDAGVGPGAGSGPAGAGATTGPV